VLIFFSVGFMFGEVVRRSSLAYIITSALFFTNEIVGLALTIIYNLTGTDLYRQIQLFLPTSPMASLALLLVKSTLPSTVSTILDFASFGGAVETSIPFSIGLILVYFVAAFIIAFVFFERSDISRKIS